MKAYGIDRLRNVAFIGHGQSGKTSLVEAALFAAGATERLGSVEAGTTVSDSDPGGNQSPELHRRRAASGGVEWL